MVNVYINGLFYGRCEWSHAFAVVAMNTVQRLRVRRGFISADADLLVATRTTAVNLPAKRESR